MITDPTALFALALCVGILGLVVLILPLLILFWSQVEPQLVGLVMDRSAPGADDEYSSQAVLPKLMKSFGSMAEQDLKKGGAASGRKKAVAKPAAKRKPAKTTARSKASSSEKTVKAAPAKSKSSSTGSKANPKSKATTKAPTKAQSATAAKAGKSSPSVKKAKAKSTATRRTPAGARRDAVLGVIYSKKPKEADDFKQIKGVAKVIEAKLHKAGVYTYRQVVEWDAAAIEAFSEKLSFRGRIRNEGWQKQCAKLHKEKYGEKIG